MASGRTNRALLGILLAASLLLVLMILRPAPAQACPKDGPCSSGSVHLQCPAAANGSISEFNFSFNVPKGARNLRHTVRDFDTNQEYDADHPICAGTSLSVTSQLTPGATEDVYKVTVTATSNGGSNPGESHDVKVSADWDLEADVGMTKVLTGGSDSFDAEEQVIFRIVIHNYGPEEARKVRLFDDFRPVPNPGGPVFTVTAVEQVAGPTANEGPLILSDKHSVLAQWTKLPVGGDIVVLVYGHANKAGQIRNVGGANPDFSSKRVEPVSDPHLNYVDKTIDVNPVGDSDVKHAAATGASGTAAGPSIEPFSWPGSALASASGVKKVQVAVLRLGGGRPFTELPARPTRKPGKCKWLKNSAGRFKGRKPRKKTCDSPVWLNAQGTGHWHLSFHGLPPGHYMLYSRAVASNGAAEGLFSAKDKNRRKFRVR